MKTAPTGPAPDHGWRIVVAGTLAGLAVVWLSVAWLLLMDWANWSVDFMAYRESAVRLVQGASLYLPTSLEGPFVPGPRYLYLYAPPFGAAMSPFAGLSGTDGAVVWYFVHVAALVLACALMPVRRVIRLWTLLIAALCSPVWSDLILGNVSSMILLPLVLGWRWLDRPAGAIAVAVAASVRISLGAFILWFVVRRAWRSVSWLLIGGLVTVLVALPFVGLDGFSEYLVVMGNLEVPIDLAYNRQVQVAANTLGAPDSIAWAMLVATWLLAIGAILVSRRRDPEVGFMVTVAASLLLAPIMWGHYLALLVLPGAFLAQRGRPWALALPLLAWLPEVLMPLWAILALLLPFAARDAEPGASEPSGSGRRRWRRVAPAESPAGTA